MKLLSKVKSIRKNSCPDYLDFYWKPLKNKSLIPTEKQSICGYSSKHHF